jgi:hypothetical protein
MLFLLLAVVFANTPTVTSSTPKGREKGAGDERRLFLPPKNTKSP